MAQTGYTPISIYYSATTTNVPTAGNLVAGELAINTADGKLFYKDSSGVVQTLATKDTAAGTFTSITDSGNLTFTGTGNRIRGDFSTTTYTNRLMFQTSTTNSSSRVAVLPNGTNLASGYEAYANSDPTNAAYITLYTNGIVAGLQSTINGTGTYLPMDFRTGGSERLRIDTSGNVGIGTSSPSAKLDIGSGNLNFSSTGQRITGDFSNATIANRVLFQSSTTNGNTNFGLIPNGTSSISAFRAYNNSDPTNASEANLSVVTTTDVRLQSTITGTGTYLPLTMYTGGGERLRIDTSGNVGIGTSSPFSAAGWKALSIDGTSQSLLDLKVGGVSTGYLYAQGTAVFLVNNIATGATVFQTNSAERMRIDSSGNVGIGTASPSASAILDAQSTTKGVRMPNMTTTQKNAISSPAAGLMVFDTTLAKLCVYSGSAWQTITSI